MTLLDKRAFYLFEVSSCGGIRAAAEHLHINPSVVSRQAPSVRMSVAPSDTLFL
ncbi:MAG: helix-turn-helix domain-containing protein [Vreelandella alkaliphila]|uniref:helix-turn-helix domain-containing protein n=1 Tax=Vreelandella alkaliphila TaxID=272774 RepID=UPI003F988C20